VKNVVALGALQGATGLFPEQTFLTAIRQALHAKSGALRELNEEAFTRGVEAGASAVTAHAFGWWT
jgi:2-oxoisovalerate ferredoxin oxidoreductase beta subunit